MLIRDRVPQGAGCHGSRASQALCLLLGGACLLAGIEARAQTAGGRFVPTFSASTTYRDVRGAASSGFERGFETSLSPGFTWARSAGRLQGTVNYHLDARLYSKREPDHEYLNSLAGTLRAEAIDNWLFMDALASISQEAISPYGQPVTGSSLTGNENRTEVRSLTLSPYIRGALPGIANYEARWQSVRRDGGRAVDADADTDAAIVSLSAPFAGTVFGWSASALHQNTSFGSGAESQSDRVSLGLTAAVDVDLRLGVTAGRESTNVVGGARRDYDNWGVNLRWTPTPRTSVALSKERRYFGDAKSIVLSHRLRRSTLTYSDVRDATSGADPFGTGQPVTLYNLYSSLFAAQQPDPVLRDLLVRELLRAIGQEPGTYVSGGLLNTAVTLQRRQDLALAVQWVRTSLTVQAFQSESRQLQDADTVLIAGPVKLSGYTASVAYRLTPQVSISLIASQQCTRSSDQRPATDQLSTSLSLHNQLGPSIGTVLSVRHTKTEGLASPSRETATTASLNLRF